MADLWRHILDGNKLLAGTDFREAVKRCHRNNYRFLAWNGELYFIDPDTRKGVPTGIRTEELE